MIEIRKEESSDQEAVHQLNLAAFKGGSEAALVDRLRKNCDGYFGFVAFEGETIVGHLLFTPVTIGGDEVDGVGLAPMAVAPEFQRCGIGSQLVQYGLECMRQSGCHFVVVLGHPEFYPRFGFKRASEYGIRCQWEGVPDDAFMVVVFDAFEVTADGVVVNYRDEFNDAV